jgi:hypothetical protein
MLINRAYSNKKPIAQICLFCTFSPYHNPARQYCPLHGFGHSTFLVRYKCIWIEYCIEGAAGFITCPLLKRKEVDKMLKECE